MAVDFFFRGDGGDSPVSLSTLSLPAADQQPEQALNGGAPFASSHYQEIDGWPVRANIRQSCTRRSCRRAVLALMASTAALLMLITACSVAGRKKDQRRNAIADRLFLGRKLSEEDKAASFKPHDVCGETQEARDEESSAETSAGGAEPLTKKRKRMEGESKSGKDTAGPSGASPLPKGKRKATAKTKHLETKADDGSEKELRDPGDWGESSKPLRQLSLTTGVEDGSAAVSGENPTDTTSPAEITPAEMAAAQALLLLWQHPLAPTARAEGELAQQEEMESQEPSTSAAASGQGPVSSGLISSETPEQPPASGPGVAPSPSQQPPPMSAEALANHPFCRVPPLQPGVVARAFNPEQASNRELVPASAREVLLSVKELLAKESLCKEDADLLVLLTEGLAAHCYFFERTPLPIRNVDQTAEMLAFRFMMFDAMAAALTATAQNPSAEWWQQFACVVPHDISHTPQGEHGRRRRKSYYGELARRFSRALGTLKRGFRPSKREVYELKYILFCTNRFLQRFRVPFYEPWRRDCPGSGEGSQHGSR